MASILDLDKAMVPLEVSSGDDYSLTHPNIPVYGLGQSSGLNARYCQVVLINVKLKPS